MIKIKKFEGDVVTNELKLSEEGKELRLINPYPLSQSDFHTLILNGNPLVGCTGDHSLSEVVSFNRLPFYEVREMKRNFWGGVNGIVNLAGEVGEPPHYLQQYFREISEIYHYSQGPLIRHYDKKQRRGVADPDDVRDELKVFKKLQPKVAKAGERMANLLQIPEIYQEMTQFSNLLKEQYNYNEIPKDIAARKFALQAYPELKLYEKELYNKFIAEEIDTLAVNTLLKHKIDSLITCKE